ncbi:HNH-endonuclease [Halorubrum virus VOLN27B]|nr:HNH-endonuclease [Halorubrum virus VOLN27B]
MNQELAGVTELREQFEKDIEKAYKLGLLHGINAQSMAQVERDVMEFEDYGWRL